MQISVLNESIGETFYPDTSDKLRSLASINGRQSDMNCNVALIPFSENNGISLSLFREYKTMFDNGAEKPHKFSNLEMYLGYIESNARNENISFTRYFLSLNHRALRYNEFMITKVGNMKHLQYFFNGYLKSLAENSVRLDHLGEIKSSDLEKILRRKIVQDALEKIRDEDSRFSKFMKHKGFKHISNWLGTMPLLFGAPPLYFPKSLSSEVLERLLNTRDPKVLMEEYDNLDWRSDKWLKAHILYNEVWIYLNIAVAAYFTYDILREVYENVEIIEDSQKRLQENEESFKDVIDLIDDNSCEELNKCLEKYSQFWKGKPHEAKDNTIASCKDSYNITEHCF